MDAVFFDNYSWVTLLVIVAFGAFAVYILRSWFKGTAKDIKEDVTSSFEHAKERLKDR